MRTSKWKKRKMDQSLYIKEKKMSNDNQTELSLTIGKAIEKLQLLQGYVWDTDIYERHVLMGETILDYVEELLGEVE